MTHFTHLHACSHRFPAGSTVGRPSCLSRKWQLVKGHLLSLGIQIILLSLSAQSSLCGCWWIYTSCCWCRCVLGALGRCSKLLVSCITSCRLTYCLSACIFPLFGLFLGNSSSIHTGRYLQNPFTQTHTKRLSWHGSYQPEMPRPSKQGCIFQRRQVTCKQKVVTKLTYFRAGICLQHKDLGLFRTT